MFKFHPYLTHCTFKHTVPIKEMLFCVANLMVIFCSCQQNNTQEKFVSSRFKYSFASVDKQYSRDTTEQTIFQQPNVLPSAVCTSQIINWWTTVINKRDRPQNNILQVVLYEKKTQLLWLLTKLQDITALVGLLCVDSAEKIALHCCACWCFCSEILPFPILNDKQESFSDWKQFQHFKP